MKFSFFIFLSLFYLSCSATPLSLPALHQAVKNNDLEKVKELAGTKKCNSNLLKDNNIEQMFFNGECFDVNFSTKLIKKTALFYVQSLEMAEFLISQGAIMNVKDKSDYTPLHYAENPAIAKFYLDYGLNIESKTKYNQTPLFIAVSHRRYDVAEFLFNQGANPYTKTEDGKSSLDVVEERSKYTFLSKPKRLMELFKTYQQAPSTTEENFEVSP